ncbi:MAG: hypothetical protein K2Q28_10880, partial [Hyphomicrobium sp.]|nr:hypothetical protein [Hyphomicrobium sp.]
MSVNNSTAIDTIQFNNLQDGDIVTFSGNATNGGDREVTLAATPSGSGTGFPVTQQLNGPNATFSSAFTKSSAGNTNFSVTLTSSDNGNRTISWSATCTRPKQNQTIGFTSTPPSPALVGGSYTPTATATSALPVTITIDGPSA